MSREQCNIKKLEANCDVEDLNEAKGQRKLNIVYSIKIPGESYKKAEFSRPPTDHTFPITDIGNNVYLKVLLQSLPRRDDIPTLKCGCQAPKRRASKEMPPLNFHEELALRMNDLTLGPPENRPLDYRCKGALFSPDLGVINSNIGSFSGVSRRLSIFSNPGSSEYLYSRASTPEKQLDEGESQGSLQEDGPPDCAGGSKDKVNYLLDDRMHTPCSESGKHKCNCDDESDQGKDNQRSSTSFIINDVKSEPKKQLDERRLKEIAKYKRRLRKESKLRKLRESGTSESATSEGDGGRDGKKEKTKEETHTSIPILQASRFDRFRAIGCYRNQTYLTLPASRIEMKSPFVESISVTPTDYRKTISVGTQTDEPSCSCGARMMLKCENCSDSDRGMVRSEGTYNLALLNRSEILLDAIRRSCHETSASEEADTNEKAMKKHKCDKPSYNSKCDINRIDVNFNANDTPLGIRKYTENQGDETNVVKRPKLRRLLPVVDRINKVVTDRHNHLEKNDMDELLLKDDDSVFANMSRIEPRKKFSSISDDDYVVCLKNEYGTFDHCDISPSPTSLVNVEGFKFPDPSKTIDNNQVPSPSEMDKFRWRFDSAASMVFHTRTGLPLTSSPAPLKRGSNCFDYDDSITGISGIKR